jgi:hypothetical protein
MDQTSIYLFLAWVTIVLARPQESEDPRAQCTLYYPSEDIPGLDDKISERLKIDTKTKHLWKTEYLSYK